MAKQSSQLEAVCSQILTKSDLEISKTLTDNILQQNIVTRIHADEKSATIRIYSKEQFDLSVITPILHDFGFTIIDEVSYSKIDKNTTIHIYRLRLKNIDIKKLERAKSNIEWVITSALSRKILRRCKIFALVYLQNLSIRQVLLLRSFIEYLNQAVLSINYETLLQTLTSHDEIARLFLHYFIIKFNPETSERESKLEEVSQLIETSIKAVPQIMDDRILKLTYALLRSLTRTNYFLEHSTIAFKIDTASFSENLKGLQPRIESFVYHPEFSGIHLRMSRISRGGLRWSERHEDYRTEIKSLMIAQEGKNSVIIPDGAKGGFVINRTSSKITKTYFNKLYSLFVNALLDLIDNRIAGEIVRDDKVVAYDEDDDYFVVAADKGTASMSDIANEIAINRNFWLGDAFASGGSNGYSHKELGITAKGALKSSGRFFIEKRVDFYEKSISIVGIGSMNGDVFGNGMLESKAFKLLAAFSHKEIFIDPNPIPIVAFEERRRLFTAENGSWSAYNKALISKGGGVFLRSDKSIELSPQIQKMIDTTEPTLSGEELIKALLKMEVDLLFNGGVGTYVKSSDESDLSIGDKQNEAVRVDASDLRCSIVCEGGNLGFTQQARIEYALNGGKINVDGIDNSAGVNISDHEVNLKILLNIIENRGILSEQERKENLTALSEQVIEMVLSNSYAQALAISRDEVLSRTRLDYFLTTINLLSTHVDVFNRHDFFIPKNENIGNIITKNGSIVRPVLASLLSYSKVFVKSLLLDSTIIDEAIATTYLHKYFPKSFVGTYEREINDHPLRREIIATMMADTVINLQGSSFISDYQRFGKAKFLTKIRSYLIANNLFGADDVRQEIRRNDYSLDVALQYELLNEIEQALEFSTGWMVRSADISQLGDTHILGYKNELISLLKRLEIKRVPIILKDRPDFNRFFSVLDYLRFSIAAIMLKEQGSHSFENVVTIFYLVISKFRIIELINVLSGITLHLENDRLLRRQLMQFIEFLSVNYTRKILNFQRTGETPKAAFRSYFEDKTAIFDTNMNYLNDFMQRENKDIRAVTTVVNQLMVSVI
jgi:glutamate dehydrogenase